MPELFITALLKFFPIVLIISTYKHTNQMLSYYGHSIKWQASNLETPCGMFNIDLNDTEGLAPQLNHPDKYM